MPEHHRSEVVRIAKVLPHPNADRLEIIRVKGYQAVVGKGQFRPGDLAVYITPDSIVPERPEFAFVWERDGAGNPRTIDGPVPERWRRVTARKFRKEWSEGLLMPLGDLPQIADGLKPDANHVNEGDDVAEILGVTHYNPPEDPEERASRGPSVKQSKIWPRSLKGWLYFLGYWLSFGLYNPWGGTHGFGNERAPEVTPPVYDVEALKNHRYVFTPEDDVVVTEKVHGSNARYTYREKGGLFGFGKGKMYAGSRKLWKSAGSTTVWRKALADNEAIERWCRDYAGFTLYGEVVPTQSAGGIDFAYGTHDGQVDFLAFDILAPDGRTWVPYANARRMTEQYPIRWAPLLYQGRFDENTVAKLADGDSRVPGARHIREGVVVRSLRERSVPGLGRAQLKLVSNVFYERTK